MAFDGVTLSAVLAECKSKLLSGRITKIQQPEKEEIMLVIKKEKETSRLMMTADATLPLIYLAEDNKPSPMTAPNFCMLLREYIGGGKIVGITQPGFERIADFEIEHLNEMGDVESIHLKFELMGRHSNIILVGRDNRILDAIKHIPADVSSVRLVLPGQEYEMPPAQDKKEPFAYQERAEFDKLFLENVAVGKLFSMKVTGFSKQTGQELAARLGLDERREASSLSQDERDALYKEYQKLLHAILTGKFEATIMSEDGIPKEYAAYPSARFPKENQKSYDSMSKLLKAFYEEREKANMIRQKSGDLRRVLDHAVERTAKKLNLQENQLASTEDRDDFRIYGELLNTYGYGLKGGEKSLTCLNYYTNEDVEIPLDPTKSASENSKRYFAKYNKKKRTYEALTKLTEETREELAYLESAKHALSMADSEADLKELRKELIAAGEIKTVVKSLKEERRNKRQGETKAKPLHYVTEDGYDLYVGKNNLQNDTLTFTLADGHDMWFHAKQVPGSHVIAKRHGKEEFPDHVYEAAAALAAYYSSSSNAKKVEIDYTERKNLKKPPAAKPGYVIYHTNYSMVAEADINRFGLTQVE